MQVKCEVFSRFGNSVDFSSGEPLGGVEASTVGADLCVRPSSPECSLFCGRTRRSAPTQATSARQFHSSNAVTSISVGADLCVRPSSPERSLFCGRTRRSAPTQATSARQFYSSNAVTPISVGTLGLSVRCIKSYGVSTRCFGLFDNGRSDLSDYTLSSEITIFAISTGAWLILQGSATKFP
ncbi:hypothetical protein Poras_0420 [Porphyromonas asaccharolytica DSM 20707]|uniref:Uncharacterized protein n=1 Tax=Porphyromonas asaccharolytica (strain ATCC 25260 / DSM 20707 / BCRC 10618 / CCUG 7834 / JCM 6326 / LMG 13178 / VPI 4198 / B440) TaxID=879243 RepID=F4KN36_PORAD|nr:hypothetical protein Poras_0420 [Porphyromonas asaccharolytica DSM 20707]